MTNSEFFSTIKFVVLVTLCLGGPQVAIQLLRPRFHWLEDKHESASIITFFSCIPVLLYSLRWCF